MQQTLNFFNKKIEIADQYQLNKKVIFHHGDTYHFVKTIPNEAINLIITSPPYNVGKSYETKKSIEAYLEEQTILIEDLIRILHPTGSICWQVGNYVYKGEVFPLDIFFYDLFKAKGLQLRNRIIWHFGHGLHAKKRLSGRYETILWFSKTKNYKFNLDPIRVPSKYPGKRHYKGKKKGQISGNPLGKNPSDIWSFVAKEWDKELWDIPNVKSNHPEKTTHPCQYPIELVERCLLALTDKGDTIFDPYAGVGSSLIAGIKHERKVIGVDKELTYVTLGKQRIHDFFQGKLKYRKIGTKVHNPNPKSKLTQIPIEWQATSNSVYKKPN